MDYKVLVLKTFDRLDRPKAASRPAFTVVELLVVSGIIGVLTAIVVPFFALALENGWRVTCTSNMKQLGVALLAYAQDNDEQGPNGTPSPKISSRWVHAAVGWAGRVYPYLTAAQVFLCPDDPTRAKMDSLGK